MVWGLVMLAWLGTLIVMIAATSGPFAELVGAFTFLESGTTDTTLAVPAALQSGDQFHVAFTQALMSTPTALIAFIIILAATIGWAATAYTKSLVLSVAAGAARNEPVSIIAMFRGARRYWRSTLMYSLPFALLATATILIAIPSLIYAIGWSVANDALAPNIWQALPAPWWIAIACALAYILLRLLTLYADAMIVQDSSRPLQDSFAYAGRFPRKALGTALTVLVSGCAVILLRELLIAGKVSGATAVNAVIGTIAFLLVLVWRLWVPFFVVARAQPQMVVSPTPVQPHSKTRKRQKPRAGSA